MARRAITTDSGTSAIETWLSDPRKQKLDRSVAQQQPTEQEVLSMAKIGATCRTATGKVSQVTSFQRDHKTALGILMNRYSAFSGDPGHSTLERLQAEANSSFRAFAELALYDDAPRTVIWAVSTSSGRCFPIAIGHGCCFQSRITQAVPALASSCFFGAGIDKA
jgi:hypothetical protein